MNTLFSLVDEKNIVAREFLEGKTRGKRLSSLISFSTDALIKKILKEKLSVELLNKICVIATGGYGRKELFPNSDLDILFLFDSTEDIPDKEMKRVLYPLWDKNIDFGYSVRTIDESIDLARKDIKVLTSLLDSRFLAGSAKLYERFKLSFIKKVLANEASGLITAIQVNRRERSKKNGDSVFILEPELKNGRGGLRDYHASLWLAKAVFGINGFKELLGRGFLKQSTLSNFNRALDYIFDIRHRLHMEGKSCNDRLSFELQPKISLAKGYRGTVNSKEVEKMMKDYYEAAQYVESFYNMILDKAETFLAEGDAGKHDGRKNLSPLFFKDGDKLLVNSVKELYKKQSNILKTFEVAKQKELRLHDYIRELIEDWIKSRRSAKWDKSSISIFKKIISEGKGLYKTLCEMNRTDVLESILPEMKHIKGRVHHDIYHTYTVDVHSIMAIRELERLELGDQKDAFPFLSRLMKDISKRDKLILYLASLLHDIGKGKGKDHSKKGGKIVAKIAERLHLNVQDKETLTFLVGNHLLMAITAQRRNLDDPVLINQFAAKVENQRNLKLLYLLTFADLRSVSQNGKALTPWKHKLFEELFEKARDLLSLGKYKKWIFDKDIEEYKENVSARLRNQKRKRAFRKFLKGLPESYFRSFSEKRIKKHFKMFEGLSKKPFGFDVSVFPDYGVSRLAVCMKDSPGLFSAIAGALSASKINILNSLIFSSTDKYVIDVFRVQDPSGKEIETDDKRWDSFKTIFGKWLKGEEGFEKEVKLGLERRKSILEPKLPQVEPNIKFDNVSSRNFSILEVYAEDRIGLLYDISACVSTLGFNIHFAKISTEGNKAQDIFYLTDLKGRKLRNKADLSKIRTALKKVVD